MKLNDLIRMIFLESGVLGMLGYDPPLSDATLKRRLGDHWHRTALAEDLPSDQIIDDELIVLLSNKLDE